MPAMCNCNTEQYFKDGVNYALEYLSDLYEGLDETDIWKKYNNK